MKHTTFENELKGIRRIAIAELKDAILANGGDVTFYNKVILPKLEGTINWISEDGTTCIVIPTAQTPLHEVIYTIDDLSIEDILAITEAIPETDDVKDVSGVYPVPVTWVDTDDVGNAGFVTEGLTQEDLNAIQDEMAESYLNYGFNEDLRNACESYGLKEKED